jgi:hypothetical protein
MRDPKMVRLISKLAAKTFSRELAWASTEVDGWFEVTFPEYSIRIFQQLRRGETFIVLRIYNANGQLIDEVDDSGFELSDFSEEPFSFMSKLYDAARRSAFGVDVAVDNILSSLENN